MCICVVVPPGECLRVKADLVLFAGNTVWFVSERVRGVRENALYKSTLPFCQVPVIRLFVDKTSWTLCRSKSPDVLQQTGHQIIGSQKMPLRSFSIKIGNSYVCQTKMEFQHYRIEHVAQLWQRNCATHFCTRFAKFLKLRFWGSHRRTLRVM